MNRDHADCPRVFVYGTLKKGECNHYYLSTAQFLGKCRTLSVYQLLDFGDYPGVLRGGDVSVSGEVYEVDAETFSTLDELEEYPHYYDREKISTPWGNAWIYYLLEHEDVGLVLNGNWTGGT